MGLREEYALVHVSKSAMTERWQLVLVGQSLEIGTMSLDSDFLLIASLREALMLKSPMATKNKD